MYLNFINIIARNSGRALPTGFSALNGIESDGTAYINPEIYPFYNLDMDFELIYKPTASAFWMLGSAVQPTTVEDIGISATAIRRFGYAASYTFPMGNVYDIKLHGNSCIINDNQIQLTYRGNYHDQIIHPFLIFKAGGSGLPPSGEFRKLKIYQGGALVRDYVPCMRNSDNIAGFYDFASSRFFTSPVGAFIPR